MSGVKWNCGHVQHRTTSADLDQKPLTGLGGDRGRLLAGVSYFLLDKAVAEYVHALPRWISEMASDVTVLGLSGIYLYPLPLIYLLCVVFRHRRGADLAWLAFWTVAASGLAVGTSSSGSYCVAGPSLWFHQHAYGFVFFRTDGAHTGFPSGHSCHHRLVLVPCYGWLGRAGGRCGSCWPRRWLARASSRDRITPAT